MYLDNETRGVNNQSNEFAIRNLQANYSRFIPFIYDGLIDIEGVFGYRNQQVVNFRMKNNSMNLKEVVVIFYRANLVPDSDVFTNSNIPSINSPCQSSIASF